MKVGVVEKSRVPIVPSESLVIARDGGALIIVVVGFLEEGKIV